MYKSQVMSMKQISSMITSHLDTWGDDNLILIEEIANSEIIKNNDISNWIYINIVDRKNRNFYAIFLANASH